MSDTIKKFISWRLQRAWNGIYSIQTSLFCEPKFTDRFTNFSFSTFNKTFKDIVKFLSELTPTIRTDPAVSHALKIREAVSLNNYHKFFELYYVTPNKGEYLLRKFFKEMRERAFLIISKA